MIALAFYIQMRPPLQVHEICVKTSPKTPLSAEVIEKKTRMRIMATVFIVIIAVTFQNNS